MKKIVIVLAAALGLAACATKDKKTPGTTEDTNKNSPVINNQNPTTPTPDTANYTSIEWIDPITKDLGKLKQGREIEITWRFKNTGDKNLIIENVTAGCGCTIPEKPEKPFAPGEEGVIKAKYNGSGSGTISKNVTVTANTKGQQVHTLLFTGEVN